MPVKTIKDQSNEFYFCTFTCAGWLNLFSIADFFSEVYKWFDIVRSKHYRICGYVITPNHLHFIVFTPAANVNLNTLISNGKRFMAYELIARLKMMNETKILKFLEDEVTASDRKRGKLHQVFRTSFDAKELYNERLILQKLDYVHHNPVSGKWQLAADFTEYLHSSAKYYEMGVQGIYSVTDYRTFLY